jgi:hypothetical protein
MTSDYLLLRIIPIPHDQGGRKLPFIARPGNDTAYRPHVRIGPSGEYLGIAVVDGPEVVSPGVECDITVALVYRDAGVDYAPLQPGVEVEVVEGARVIARGRVVRRWVEDGAWHQRTSA